MAASLNWKLTLKVAVALTLLLTLSRCSYFAPIVTKAEYDQLEMGMSYEQVCAIIGERGKLTGFQGIVGFASEIRSESYTWRNVSGSYMNATFGNYRLVKKSYRWLR